MYKYEFANIIECEGKSDDDIQTVIGRIRELVAGCHGRIIKEDVWGKKELCYPIKKQNHGFYMFTNLMMAPADMQELQSKMKLADGILRYLVINLSHEPGYQKQQEQDPAKTDTDRTKEKDAKEEPEADETEEEVTKEELPKPAAKEKTVRTKPKSTKAKAPAAKPEKVEVKKDKPIKKSPKKEVVVPKTDESEEPKEKPKESEEKSKELDELLKEIL
ncbi:30S ribosomal protein S6 [Patescibacteria group bacterium]|nr:30S ribosomal protein S6 [Patescibacteria group bacterium]